MNQLILVSSCLAGVKCRYDGKDNRIEEIVQLVETGKAIAVCPEIFGGMPKINSFKETLRTMRFMYVK